MAPAQVLVVDDDAALSDNVAEILKALDVNVVLAPSIQAALGLAGTRSFDLALIDVRLPDGEGTSLVPRLRTVSPLTAAVLITGDATIETAVAAVRGGVFAYLLKPVSPVELLDTARRALDQVAFRREHERLQNELEQSERRHREVVEAVPALVLALDRSGRIRIWNRRLEDLTGFSRAEKVDTDGRGLIRTSGVSPLTTKKGHERLIRWDRADVEGSSAGGDDGDVWTYAVGIDVTGEQEMLRRTLRAERLAAVGTMAAGLAHEVRNPLNSALLQLQVLGRRIDRMERDRTERNDPSSEPLKLVLNLVEDEIRRLEGLVKDFLAFVQPRPLNLQPTALTEVCRSVVAFLTPEATAAGIHMHEELAAVLPPVAADPERLRQILLNLMRNAVEAMASGGDLTLRTRVAGDFIEFDVSDTGPGFPDETPIFDAFFTTKPKGTGLGLTIVHRIVNDHGGTMRVRSIPGDTCFTVALPLARG